MSNRSESSSIDDYADNVSLYTINYSDKTTAVTIEFRDEDVFNRLKNKLSDLYSFKRNKNSNGLEVTTFENSVKVVLSLYPTTRTLFVQGRGYTEWMSNVFDQISDELSDTTVDLDSNVPYGINASSNSPLSLSSPRLTLVNIRKSPLTGLKNLVNSLRSPTKRTPLKDPQSVSGDVHAKDENPYIKVTRSSIKGIAKAKQVIDKKQCDKSSQSSKRSLSAKQIVNVDEDDGVLEAIPNENVLNENSTNIAEIIDKSPKDQSVSEHSDAVMDETVLKTLHESSAPNDQSVSEHSEIVMDETKSKTLHESSAKQCTITEREGTNQSLKAKLKTKCELVEKLESELATLKKKSTASTNKCKTLEEDITKLKQKQKENKDKYKLLETENAKMKNSISKITGDLLIVEEENAKLKSKLADSHKERNTLQTELIKTSINNENIDDKIQEMSQSVEMKLTEEVSNLKEVLLKEVSSMKSQISACQKAISTVSSKSTTQRIEPITSQRQTNNNANEHCASVSIENQERNHKTKSPSSIGQSTSQPPSDTMLNKTNDNTGTLGCQRNDQNGNSANQKSAIIFGDSMTCRLSAKRMSNNKLQVKIRSRRGHKIENLENELKSPDRDSQIILKESAAVVLHLGTNNVSHADSASDIADKMESVISSIKCVNPEAKILVSGIIPRKNNRWMNNQIEKANERLQDLCKNRGYHFISHTNDYLSNGRSDDSLYYDNIHLNSQGGNLFGTRLRKSLDDVLFNQQQESMSLSDTNQYKIPSFVNGRQSGSRRMNGNQNRTLDYANQMYTSHLRQTRNYIQGPPQELPSAPVQQMNASSIIASAPPVLSTSNGFPPNVSMSTSYTPIGSMGTGFPTNTTSMNIPQNDTNSEFSPTITVDPNFSHVNNTVPMESTVSSIDNTPPVMNCPWNSNRIGYVQSHQNPQNTYVQHYTTNGYQPHTYANFVNTGSEQFHPNYAQVAGVHQWNNGVLRI